MSELRRGILTPEHGSLLRHGVRVIERRCGLTAQEALVSWHVVRGLSNKQVAQVLDISLSTVRTHLLSACHKVGAASRGELAYLVFCETAASLLRERERSAP